jgi:hypothetical protein
LSDALAQAFSEYDVIRHFATNTYAIQQVYTPIERVELQVMLLVSLGSPEVAGKVRSGTPG